MTTSQRTLSIYWQHARKYKRRMWIIYPLIVVAMFAEDFLEILLISNILDKIASNNIDALKSNRIWLIFIAIILLEAFGHLIWNIVVRIFWRTQELVMVDLNMTVYEHLQKMSYSFFANRFAGSIVSQVNKFVASFERLTDPLTWNVFKLVVSIILTTIILLFKVPLVAFAILAITAIYVPLIWHVRRKQIPLTTKWASSETERTGQLADTVSNIVAIKSFANEKYETNRMLKKVTAVYDRSIDTMKMNMNQELGTGSVQRSINIAVIILSVLLAIRGNIAVGTIYLSLTFSIAIMRRLWDLNNTFRNFARVFGDAYDMTKILQIEPEVKDPVLPLKFKASQGSVEFRSIDFKYTDDTSKQGLFNKLNLRIKPGEKIGLVGPSGGGKTTITKLLLRFMDIQQGAILIDGQNIAKSNQSDVRKAVSYVPQEPLLFHRTLSENIGYGMKNATKSQIIEVAKKAHAHEFVVKLANQYDTLVGERGVKLSGGQKQRVAIARAMLKDSPIILLDEATSALDSESEQLIQSALWELMKDRTAIVIAHRLSTIQKMDRILVMDEGKIVEEGIHNQLKDIKNGLYAKLWSHQSGGFIQE